MHSEALLHYTWKHRLTPLGALQTTDGSPLDVIDPGLHNHDAGPDFFNAKVKIDGMMWAGNVEIHLRSSDWYRHGHQTDAAYNNVILHVAESVDCQVVTQSGKTLPQLELKIPEHVRHNYEELSRTEEYPRCHTIVPSIDPFVAHSWMDTLVSERLSGKATAVVDRLQRLRGDWERTLFCSVARSFGFGLNGDPMERWAELVPLEKLGKHRDELLQIEAVFLGLSGLLPADESPEAQQWAREFAYQQRLFTLPESMQRSEWKYLRLRPQNFPHVRILELASIYSQARLGMASVVERAMSDKPLQQLRELFDTGRKGKSIGKATRESIIVNAILPVLYAYADQHADEALRERVGEILQLMPSEDNRIMRIWRECGLSVKTAADSQALIQLKKVYCDRRDCLRCRFGYIYLKQPLR